MSHYVKSQCEGMDDVRCLAQALRDQGCTDLQEGETLTCKGWGSQRATVQVKLSANGKAGNHYDAGFAKTADGKLELIKESMDGHLDKKWLDRVRQNYQRVKALQLARAKGLKLTGERRIGSTVQLIFNQ